MSIQYPLINGKRYEWSSVEIKVNGTTILGCKEIKYSHKLSPKKVYGTHAQPIGRTRGEYEASGSITMYRQEADELRTALGPGYMEKVFDVTVSYADDGQPTVTDILQACRIAQEDSGGSQGGDALEVPLELDILAIKLNGVAPVNNPLF